MLWQDLVLMVGSFGLNIALAPVLWAREKPPRPTCGAYGVTLGTFTFVYITLSLWLAAIAVTIGAIMWLILLFQGRGGVKVLNKRMSSEEAARYIHALH